MSKAIAVLAFNRLFAQLCEDHLTQFGPLLPHFRDVFMPYLTQEWKTTGVLWCDVDRFLNEFATSFVEHPELVTMLKQHDQKLVLKSEHYQHCTLLRHLELRKLWKSAECTEAQREQIWN